MDIWKNMVSAIVGGRRTIVDREAMVEFIDRRASFMCQKCVVEFCRVRAGIYWQKLFTEAEFLGRLDQSLWRSYPYAVAMLTEMAEAALRPHAGLRQRLLPGVLETVARDVFARYPVPQGEAADFWDVSVGYVRERLDETQLAPPRAVKDMTKPSARRIFEALPLHEQIVTNDFDYIRNNLRMNLLRAHEDFIEATDFNLLCEDLLGERKA